MSGDLALLFRGKPYERGQADDVVDFEVDEITEIRVDESHALRLAKLLYQMTAEVEGLLVDFQVIDLQLEPVDEEHRRNWHRPGAREQKSLRSSPGEGHDRMYLHVAELHVVAVVLTMK
jgi:hypothetical protein